MSSYKPQFIPPPTLSLRGGGISCSRRVKEFEYAIKRDMPYAKTNGICPVCGGPLYKNVCTTLLSFPPKYMYCCYDCNYNESGYDDKYKVIPNWREEFKERVQQELS